jgi:hypothetical protein
MVSIIWGRLFNSKTDYKAYLLNCEGLIFIREEKLAIGLV